MKIPITAAALLGLLGVVEVVLKCIYIPLDPPGWTLGLIESAQDPGKSLFHILILPTSLYLLLKYFQAIDIRHAFSTSLKKKLNLIILSLLALVPPIYSYTDSLSQFFDKTPMPWDFSDQEVSEELMKVRLSSLENIKDKLKDSNNNINSEYKNYSDALKKYQSSLDRNFSNYIKFSSLRKKYADFLSFLGVTVACMLVGAVALSAGIRNRIESGFIDKLFLAYAIMATWIPFRMYSDWHGSLGDPSAFNDGLVIASVIIVVLGILFILFKKPTFKVSVTAASITLICTIIGAIGAFKLQWFSGVANNLYIATPLTLFSIYIVIFIAFASIVVFVSEEPEKINKDLLD